MGAVAAVILLFIVAVVVVKAKSAWYSNSSSNSHSLNDLQEEVDAGGDVSTPGSIPLNANATTSLLSHQPGSTGTQSSLPRHEAEGGNTTQKLLLSGKKQANVNSEESKNTAVELAPLRKTFATSNYKHFYDQAKRAPFQHELLHAVNNVVNLYARRVNPNLDKDTLEDGIRVFMTKLQEDAFKNQKAMRTDVDAVAEYLWTSTKTHGVVKRLEFCSVLNAVIRDDIFQEIEAAAVIFRSINARRVKRVADAKQIGTATYPRKGETWRGSSFRNEFQDFFTQLVGQKYRVPGFLATSNKRKVAVEFVTSVQELLPRALWHIQFDRRGKRDHAYRVQHMTFVSKTLFKDEHEYLFSPYSVFTLVSVIWSDKLRKAHEFTIEAAIDNKDESEDLPLTPWY